MPLKFVNGSCASKAIVYCFVNQASYNKQKLFSDLCNGATTRINLESRSWTELHFDGCQKP